MSARVPERSIKRVMKDYKTLVEEGPESGIFVKTLNDDLSIIYMMIMGPVDSVYEGCPMFFTIEPGTSWNKSVMTYPGEPPRVYFHSPYSIRCHPNLYQPSQLSGTGAIKTGGKVCLSILGTWPGPSWGALMSFMTIAQTILGILDSLPLCHEPAYYNSNGAAVKNYSDYVQYVCAREAVEKLIVPAFESKIEHCVGKMFSDEIVQWTLEHRSSYINRFYDLSDKYDAKTVNPPSVYGDTVYSGRRYDYNQLVQAMSFF